MNGSITLDYTGREEPVTIGDIKDDCDKLFEFNLECSRIVLWESQLEFFVADAEARLGAVAICVREGEKLWGIPLAIRKTVCGLDVMVQA